jgi:DNA-binding NarL/FixJ family response regulator
MAAELENLSLKVLIVDGHPLYRDALTRLIARQTGWALCGQVDNELVAREVTASAKPDLIIMSLHWENHGGLDLLRTLKTCSEKSRILVTSDDGDPQYVERALRAGANGYLLKTENAEEVQAAFRSVASGELYLSPSLVSKMLRRSIQSQNGRERSGIESLTNRELRIMELLGEGLAAREIARRLHLSRKTVDSHRENIKHKLGLASASALTRYACKWLQRESQQNSKAPSPPA